MKKKSLFFAFISLIISLAFFSSLVFVEKNISHDHLDDDCPVCAVISTAVNFISSIASPSAYGISAASVLVLAVFMVKVHLRAIPHATLVSMKVEFLD